MIRSLRQFIRVLVAVMCSGFVACAPKPSEEGGALRVRQNDLLSELSIRNLISELPNELTTEFYHYSCGLVFAMFRDTENKQNLLVVFPSIDVKDEDRKLVIDGREFDTWEHFNTVAFRLDIPSKEAPLRAQEIDVVFGIWIDMRDDSECELEMAGLLPLGPFERVEMRATRTEGVWESAIRCTRSKHQMRNDGRNE